MEKVDVILPIFNPNKQLFEAIDSIVNQSYTEWHLYVIDDASTKNWLKKIKEKYEEYSSKITYFQFDKNKRAAACRNFAISKGTGEYIAFIDQDDVWLPNKLELQVNCMKSCFVDAVHGNMQFIDNDNNIILQVESAGENGTRLEIEWKRLTNIELAKKILLKPNIRIISSMVTREMFQKIGGFKDQFFGGEDELFWFEIAYTGKIGYLNEILFFRREHNNNAVVVYRTERLFGYCNALRYIDDNYIMEKSRIISDKIKAVYYTLLTQSFKEKKVFYFFLSILWLISKQPVFLMSGIIKIIKKKIYFGKE